MVRCWLRPRGGHGPHGGRRRGREKYAPSACPAPAGARKCMPRSNRGAQVHARPPWWARKCMHGPRGAQASVCPVPSNSRRVHVPLAKTQSSAFRRNTLVPRPPARRQRGGKAPPLKRLPAPQAKPRAKCRQELHARPRELAPKKRRPHQMVRAPTHGTSCGRCNEPQPDAPTSRRAPQPRGRGARPGPGRRPSRGPAPRGSATGRREEPRAPRRHAVRSGTPRGR